MYQQDEASSRSPVCPGSSTWSRAQDHHPAVRFLLSAALSLQVAAPSVLSERCLASTALWEMPLGAVLFQVEMPGEVVQPFISAGLCPFSPRSSAARRMQTDNPCTERDTNSFQAEQGFLFFFLVFPFPSAACRSLEVGNRLLSSQLLGWAGRVGRGPSSARVPSVLVGARRVHREVRMPLSCKSRWQFYYVNKWCLHIHLLLLLVLVSVARYANKQRFCSSGFISFLVSH